MEQESKKGLQLDSLQPLDLFGGPSRSRTGDLLIKSLRFGVFTHID